MDKRKNHSASFKSKVALEAIKGMADTFSRSGRQSRDADQKAQIKELHAKIGELTVERDFLQKAFVR